MSENVPKQRAKPVVHSTHRALLGLRFRIAPFPCLGHIHPSTAFTKNKVGPNFNVFGGAQALRTPDPNPPSSVNGGRLGTGRTANARYIRVFCLGRYVEIRGDSSTLLLPLLLAGTIDNPMPYEIALGQKRASKGVRRRRGE